MSELVDADRARTTVRDPRRLAALRRLALVDTPVDEAFDRLARLAGRVLDAPVALVSLVDEDRQFFKSCVGLPEPWASERATPLSHSFCQYVLDLDGPLVVEDARRDPVLASNLAIRDLDVVAYLGIPLRAPGGESIGSFCVIDDEPRAWTERDVAILTDLAAAVTTEIELRVHVLDEELARRRLGVQYAVARVLAEATDVERAARAVMQAVGTELGWDVAALWHVEDDALVCVEAWHRPETDAAAFLDASRRHRFARGEGFPGSVWAAARATWLPDIANSAFPRAPAAAAAGLHAAVGFPLVVGGQVTGVLEFLAGAVREEDPDVLELMDALASQLGQFLEREESEEALRASDARTRAVVAGALDCVVTIDHAGRILEFNPAAEATFGYPRDEVIGRIMADLIVPPALREAHWAGFERYLATGEARILGRRLELAAVDASGHTFPIELTVTRVDVPGEPVFTAYIRDITDRRQIEEERERLVRELEAQANAARVLEHTTDGVLMVDVDDVVRLWNPAAARITGVHPDDVVGRPASDVIPEWGRIREGAAVSAARGEPDRSHVVPLTIGGREVWLSFSSASFAEGSVYAFRDVSDDRRLEQMRSDFVATASHELRTPLAAIFGAAVTLSRPQGEIDASVHAPLLEMIVTQSERLRTILDRLLLAAKLDAPGYPTRTEAVDVAAVARDIVTATASAQEAVSVALVAPSALPRVASDAEQLRQVLSNLVDNAVKYSPPGTAVEVRIEPLDGVVRVAVEDSGIGIPAAERQRIFEKFYRLDPNMSRGVPGTGLGLYIARELVRRMRGRIWADANEHGGSTFVVEIPVAPAGTRAASGG